MGAIPKIELQQPNGKPAVAMHQNSHHRLAIRLADGFFSRLRGLLFSAALQPGEGLLIRPCGAVHTMLMSYPIDVVFLDRAGRIRRIVPHLKPWRAARYSGAYQALELSAGEAARIGLRAGQLFYPEQGLPKRENLA